MFFQIYFICRIYQPVINIQFKKEPILLCLIIDLSIFGIDSWIIILKYFGAQIVLDLASKSSFKLALVSLWQNQKFFLWVLFKNFLI